MWDFDIRPYLLLMIGFMFLIIGPLNALVYQRPSEVGINIFLIVAGVASVIIAYFNLPIEDRMYIRNSFAKFGITKGCIGCCIDCKFYGCEHEVSMIYVDGIARMTNEPVFSEGLCIRQGMLIQDGFRQRECYYFKQREST